MSWEQAGNHRSRHQGLSPQRSLTQVMHEGFFWCRPGAVPSPSTPTLERAPTTRCCDSQETPCSGPQAQLLSSTQQLTSSPSHRPWHLQEQGYEKVSREEPQPCHQGSDGLCFPAEVWQHHKLVPALRGEALSITPLPGSYKQGIWGNPTSSGTGAGTPATPGSGVPFS